jgi:hypothetical protein
VSPLSESPKLGLVDLTKSLILFTLFTRTCNSAKDGYIVFGGMGILIS